MHGLIHERLAAFAGLELGFDLDRAYPDEELLQIVAAAAESQSVDPATLLEQFGRFLVPTLLAAHPLPEDWRTLDVVEHTEQAVHEVVRRDNPDMRPPRLRAVRTSPNELRLVYGSRRRLCAVARGIVGGLADHFGDQVTINEPRCVHNGDSSCEIVIRLAARS